MSAKIKLSQLKKRISFFLFVLLPILASSQSNFHYKLQSKSLTVQEILTKWSTLSDQTLNYRVDDLPTEKYTFSVEGTYDEITEQLYPILGLQYKLVQSASIITKIKDASPSQNSIVFTVVDEDNLPLPFAHIFVEALDINEVSSIDGKVKLDYFIAASDTLKFKYIGYEDSYFTLKRIYANKSKVMMNPSTESLSEIIVIGSSLSPVSLEKINPSDIPQAGSVDQDVLTIAQNLPGINNPSESFQDLIIRGGSPDQVQYQWNGIRILQSSHLYGKLSSINPYMIDKLEISKDGYSASSQGTVSGGLHMKSKNKIDSLSSSVHLNLLYANIGFSIPIRSNLSVKFALRQSLPNRFQSPITNAFQEQIFQFGRMTDEATLIDFFDLEEFVRLQTGIQFGDRQVSVRYQPTPRLTFNFDLIQIENKLDFQTISEELEIAKQDLLSQSNLGYHLSGKHLWNSNISTSLEWSRSGYSYEYLEYPETDLTLRTEHQNAIDVNNVKLSNKFHYKFLSARMGYEYNTWDAGVTFADRVNNQEDIYANNSNEHVLFLALHPQIYKNLNIDIGVRYSAYNKSLNNRKIIEPRLHLKYRLTPSFQIHSHYGKYHQYLSRRNFFTPLQADNGFWYLSDESAVDFLDFIDIVESTQYGGGIDYSYKTFDFSVDIYRKSLLNVYSSSFDLSTNENPFNVGDVNIQGLELMGRYQFKKHKILSTYEYTNEEISFDFIDRPTLNPFSQPHRFSFVYEYQWKFLCSVVQYNFANGRPFSQAEELIIENNSATIGFEDFLNSRVPDYHRVNLSLQTLPLGKKWKYSLGVQVNNLLDRENIIKNQYFINLLTDPLELGKLEKRGIPRSFNVFFQVDI